MDIRIETITPARAESMLNANNSNRRLRDGVVERYADDMKNGKWTKCPTPISFYEDGDIADGQHRLFAIIESDTSQVFPVARGLSRSDGLNIDTGLNRSIIDNARISGVDRSLSTTIITAARSVAEGTHATRAKSNSAKLQTVTDHREAAEWASTNVKRVRYLCPAPVLGAVGRAWYYEQDKDKLKRFCDVLGTGFMDGEKESAAIAIRNHLLAKQSMASTNAMWVDTFTKTMNAISYFMKGKPLKVLKPIGEEAYPLPKKRATKAK